MSYTPYRDIPDKIRNREEFRGSSSRGANVTLGRPPEVSEGYEVYSYDTLIAIIKGSFMTYFDNEYHSPTTTRLQNIIIKIAGIKDIPLGMSANSHLERILYNNCLIRVDDRFSLLQSVDKV